MPTPARKRSQTHRKALRKRMQFYRRRAKSVHTASENSLTRSLPADFSLGPVTSKQIYSMDGGNNQYRSYFWKGDGSSMLIDNIRNGADQDAIRAEMVADLEKVREKQDVLKDGEIMPSEILINTTDKPNDQEDAVEFVREMVEDVNDLHNRNITVADVQIMPNRNGATMRIVLSSNSDTLRDSLGLSDRDPLTIGDTQQVMPRDYVPMNLAAGQPGPTPQRMLEGRIGSILRDALERETTSQKAMRLFRRARQKVPIPPGLDPFSVRFNTDNLIVNMAHDLPDGALKLAPDALKASLVDRVMNAFVIEGRPHHETRLNVAARVDHFLNPHINNPTNNLRPRKEILMSAYQSVIQANPRPVPGPQPSRHQLIVRELHDKDPTLVEQALIQGGILPPNLDITPSLYKLAIAQFVVNATLANGPLPIAYATEAALRQSILDNIDFMLDGPMAQSERAIFTDALRVPNAEIRALINTANQNNPNNEDLIVVAARTFLAQDAAARPALVKPTNAQKGQLTAALEAMPVVQAMYNGDFSNIQGSTGLGGFLDIMDAAAQQNNFQQNSLQLEGRVRRALLIFESLVETNRRPPDERITRIEINPDNPDGTPFRGDSNRNNDKIRIGVADDVPVYLHELGHQTEYVQSLTQYMDIRSLLEFRLPDTQLNPFIKDTDLVDLFGNGAEMAFKSDMPALGPYAAKVYQTGNTEVMSKSLEFFSDPAKARTLVQNDPVLAAMMLRAIRPNDFQSYINSNDPLRPAALQILQGVANWQSWLPRGANGHNP